MTDGGADLVYRRKAELLEAAIGEEIVALDADKGNCFGFNSVAADVWRKLDRPRKIVDIERELLDEYEVSPEECASELRELLHKMEQANLVERVAEKHQAV